MKEDSEKENSNRKVQENSDISKNSDNKVEENSATSKFRENFLKNLDLMFPTRKSEKKDKKIENLEDQIPKDSEKKDKESKNLEDQAHEHDPHAFPMAGDFLSSDKLKNLKSRDNNLVLVLGVVAGALLICAGIFLIVVSLGSPDRVADNVEFGDTVSFSAFLILVGVLIMGGVLARRFLEKSFFKGINKEIESHNGTSSDSTEKEYKKV